MYFVFLNASKVDTIQPLDSKIFNSDEKGNYFEFLWKLCPHRTENTLSLNLLTRKFKEKFNLSIDSVKSILKKFFDEDILQLGYDDGVKLNLLANQTRNDIFKLICAYPGIYISLIRSYLELGPHQTIWHLKFLLDFKYIIEIKIGNVKSYSEPQVPFNRILLGFMMCKNSLRQMLNVLYKHPNGLTISKLQKLIEKPRSSLFYVLKNLQKVDIVTRISDSENIYKIKFDYFSIFHDVWENYRNLFGHKSHQTK